jgi:outer membrane protein assembly factor BamB
VGSHVYTISCGNPGAPAQASVMVSATVPTTTLSVFPAAVKVGQDFALTWDSPRAQSCTASQGWSGSVANSGQETMTATQAGTFQYALMCTNAGGSDNRSVSLTVAPAPAQPPATAFQITPNHAGVTSFSGTLSFPATPTWSVTLPGAVSYPLIADGKVFVTVANQGSYGTKLYALDQATGSTLWGPVAIDGTYFWSNATYENGTVFVVQFDGTLSSFNAATGAPGWSTNLPGQYAFSAPPTAYGGLVFVGGAGSGGTVYAVDQSNGVVKWSASVANGDKSSPTLTPTGLFVTYPCQAYDFAPDTGAEVWHKSNGCSGGGGRTSPAANAVLYARYFDIYTGDSIYEFDSSTGDQLGQLSSETVPAVTSTQLFQMSSGTLQAVNLSTGSVQWSFTGDGGLVTAPIVINNRVIVGSSAGKIYAVDAATGVSIWSSAAAAGMNATDEQNVSAPTSGLAAGEGYLIAPAGSKLSAWKIVP